MGDYLEDILDILSIFFVETETFFSDVPIEQSALSALFQY
jgi:hypothetical protein